MFDYVLCDQYFGEGGYSGQTLLDDLQLIADMVEPGTRALDVGCGDGSLLAYLMNFKRVDARGMELSQAGVNAWSSS